MAETNFTRDGRETERKVKLFCSTTLTGESHKELIYLAAFNVFLSITAFLGNTLILVALRKESSLHPPSKLLLRCLTVTDLCVGVIAEPLLVVYWISLVHKSWDFCRYAFYSGYIFGFILCSVSLLVLTAISVDRLLALLLRLRYRQVVTLKRLYVILVTFWTVSTAVAICFLENRFINYWYSYIAIPLCVVISAISYTKIFLELRSQQRRGRVQDLAKVQRENPTQTIRRSKGGRYRKAVSSALWLQLVLAACYLPYSVVSVLFSDLDKLSSFSFLAWQLAVTLVYLNSSLNPFLYCWKIPEVRQAVKLTIRQVICCSPS